MILYLAVPKVILVMDKRLLLTYLQNEERDLSFSL